jgi:glutamate-5-semialdehyde dehydrogenase
MIDLLIPRGGQGLIDTVLEHARVPVIKHSHGVCHVFVHQAADPAMAEGIVVNAKCQRPATCNAAETLLIDRAGAEKILPRLVKALRAKGVKLFGDEAASQAAGEKLALPVNWETEYLDLTMAIRVVDGVKGALEHLEKHGSHHSDAIVTEDRNAAQEFLRGADSAAVYWNASTRFTDGAEFGFGAEIGISTDKIHARGPMGLEELTSYKYVVTGHGQLRE